MFHIILFSILGVGLAYMLIPPFLRMLRESNDDFVKSIKENKFSSTKNLQHQNSDWLYPSSPSDPSYGDPSDPNPVTARIWGYRRDNF